MFEIPRKLCYAVGAGENSAEVIELTVGAARHVTDCGK